MDAELHITVQHAGDPEKLSELLNAAIAVQEFPVRMVVPTGYRCHECNAGDGGHVAGCSMIVAGQVQELGRGS